MQSKNMKPVLDRRGAFLAGVAIVLTAIFQGTWYLAPSILTFPLWSGSSLNVGFLLGTLSIFAPILIAWFIIRGDKPAGTGETFEVSNH